MFVKIQQKKSCRLTQEILATEVLMESDVNLARPQNLMSAALELCFHLRETDLGLRLDRQSGRGFEGMAINHLEAQHQPAAVRGR